MLFWRSALWWLGESLSPSVNVLRFLLSYLIFLRVLSSLNVAMRFHRTVYVTRGPASNLSCKVIRSPGESLGQLTEMAPCCFCCLCNFAPMTRLLLVPLLFRLEAHLHVRQVPRPFHIGDSTPYLAPGAQKPEDTLPAAMLSPGTPRECHLLALHQGRTPSLPAVLQPHRIASSKGPCRYSFNPSRVLSATSTRFVPSC